MITTAPHAILLFISQTWHVREQQLIKGSLAGYASASPMGTCRYGVAPDSIITVRCFSSEVVVSRRKDKISTGGE